MPRGPGKYDPQCERVLVETSAQIVLLMVINGNAGTGFSLNSTIDLNVAASAVPALLRNIADSIERDLGQ